MKAKDLVIHLVENYNPDDELAYVLYSRDDVGLYLLSEKHRFVGVALTDVEADEVLQRMVRHHDCENGMTWLSMDAAIEQVLEERT